MQCGCCRDTIAQFVSSTFPGPIYPGYAERLAAGNFEISASSPGFPVTGESLTSDIQSMSTDVGLSIRAGQTQAVNVACLAPALSLA